MPIVGLRQDWHTNEFRRTITVGSKPPEQLIFTKAPVKVTKAEWAELQKTCGTALVEIDPNRAARVQRAAELQAEREASDPETEEEATTAADVPETADAEG